LNAPQGGSSDHGGHPAGDNGSPARGRARRDATASRRPERRRAPPVASATVVGARPCASGARCKYGPIPGSGVGARARSAAAAWAPRAAAFSAGAASRPATPGRHRTAWGWPRCSTGRGPARCSAARRPWRPCAATSPRPRSNGRTTWNVDWRRVVGRRDDRVPDANASAGAAASEAQAPRRGPELMSGRGPRMGHPQRASAG
jgi:hypothetical protein